MKRPKNNSSLFNVFSGIQKSKKDLNIQKIGVNSLTVAFIAVLVYSLFGGNFSQDKLYIRSLLFYIFIIGSFTGILIFIGQGVHYIGKEESKKSFIWALLHVLSRVFLYIFLPSIIITLVILIFAYFSGNL